MFLNRSKTSMAEGRSETIEKVIERGRKYKICALLAMRLTRKLKQVLLIQDKGSTETIVQFPHSTLK
jgi:hypothetical protein